jgi:3-dehydroquinate synthase
MNNCKTNFLKKDFVDFLFSLKKRLFVITDENIQRIYKDLLKNELPGASWLVIPPGESYKTREMKQKIEDQLLSMNIRSNDVLLAIGGGVVTDLIGFVASTLSRGVDYINIPTTLLGMVDASVGGKTGVNTPFGKNSVGVFYPPIHVHIQMDFLSTLSKTQRLIGLAEVIKYGLISDPFLFLRLEKEKEKWDCLDKDFIQYLVDTSRKIKESVVNVDFMETGYRQILNFGHTVAHGLELMTSYQIPHGFALAIGLLIESYISYQEGFCPYDHVIRVKSLLQYYEFPLDIFSEGMGKALYQAMTRDKKNLDNEVYFVHINQIGRYVNKDNLYSFPITKNKIDRAIDWVLCNIV